MNLENRRYVIVSIFVLVGVLYAFRLFYMQVFDNSWKLRAQEIAEKRIEIVPARGVILDRNGLKIVSNKTYFNLMMIEDEIRSLDTVAFAELIGWTVEEVRQRFIDIVEGEGTYLNPNTGIRSSNYQKIRAYPFIKEMTLEEVSRIAPHLAKFPGFYEVATSMRNYTFGVGANILGYLSEVNGDEVKKDPFYSPGSKIGRSGIEKYYENILRGRKGVKYVITSAMNNTVGSYENGAYDTIAEQAPAVTLGLDMLIQEYGEKLMKNKRGSIVAIEPSSGEILAMVSSPSFDPNLLVGNRKIKENYPKLVTDQNKPLFPRPLAAEYPPGSIFKLVQSLIGMQEGVITANTGFPCDKSVVGCHNHSSATCVSDAVKFSCNPYFYAVMRRIIQKKESGNLFKDAELGLNKWNAYMSNFGLGKKLQTDVFGERNGLIPNSAYYDKRYGHHQWAFSTIRSISIGQGEVQLTPLQMANIAAIIANRGWFITPHFLKNIGDQKNEDFSEKHQTNVDPHHFESVIHGMERVVNEPGGTAKLARNKDIVICGKTGTVENPPKKDHSVFIAFAPKDAPKIAIGVIVENAGFGGTWAAPIASLMIEKYLNRAIADQAKEKRILDAVILPEP